MDNKELFEIIINQETLSWEDIFANINTEVADIKLSSTMLKVLSKINVCLIKGTINPYDMDGFVDLCRKIVQFYHNNINYIEEKVTIYSANNDLARQVVYCQIVSFSNYNTAKLYKHKIKKDGVYKYCGEDSFTFYSFRSFYLFTQELISNGYDKSMKNCGEWIRSALELPSKM